jgi:hypothetical protein
MRFVRGFAGFWYDFIVGDDWKIAAAVVAVLAIGAIGVATSVIGLSVLAPVVALLLVVAFAVGLVVDVRR